MARGPARLPDALVALAPDRHRRLDLAGGELVELVADPVERARVDVDRVEEGAVDVVLALGGGAVSDPHRLSAPVAAQVVERRLGQLLLAADPVHDLKLRIARADRLHEGHEVRRLVVEAERVEGPEGEGGVADPGVAVVPVADAAGRLGERGRQRRDHAARRRVHQPLQGEGRALELRAPPVVGEPAAPQPLAPALRGLLEQLLGLVDVGGHVGGVARPAEGDVAAVAGRELPAAVERPVGDVEGDVREQAQLALPDPCGCAEAVLVRLPAGGLAAVVGPRLADELRLDLAGRAVHRPDQHVMGAEPLARLALDLLHGHDQAVADHRPARLGRPGRLDHVRPGQVAAGEGDPLVGTEPQPSRVAIEDRAEHARRVEAGQAEPLDRAVGGEQGAGLAVGEEAVGADRGKRSRTGHGIRNLT